MFYCRVLSKRTTIFVPVSVPGFDKKHAEIKAFAEDFCVDEIGPEEGDDTGPHIRFRIEKRGLTTEEVLFHIAKELGIDVCLDNAPFGNDTNPHALKVYNGNNDAGYTTDLFRMDDLCVTKDLQSRILRCERQLWSKKASTDTKFVETQMHSMSRLLEVAASWTCAGMLGFQRIARLASSTVGTELQLALAGA